jgi:hypothetical protein
MERKPGDLLPGPFYVDGKDISVEFELMYEGIRDDFPMQCLYALRRKTTGGLTHVGIPLCSGGPGPVNIMQITPEVPEVRPGPPRETWGCLQHWAVGNFIPPQE